MVRLSGPELRGTEPGLVLNRVRRCLGLLDGGSVDMAAMVSRLAKTLLPWLLAFETICPESNVPPANQPDQTSASSKQGQGRSHPPRDHPNDRDVQVLTGDDCVIVSTEKYAKSGKQTKTRRWARDGRVKCQPPPQPPFWELVHPGRGGKQRPSET